MDEGCTKRFELTLYRRGFDDKFKTLLVYYFKIFQKSEANASELQKKS